MPGGADHGDGRGGFVEADGSDYDMWDLIIFVQLGDGGGKGTRRIDLDVGKNSGVSC